MAALFLYAPEDFHNLCLLARTMEVLGQRECHVFDPHQLVRERYGKVRTRELRAVSAGAFEKIRWCRVEQPDAFLAAHPGRVVATVLDRAAVPLSEHRFAPSDLLLIGSEGGGLPPQVVAASAVAVTIPVFGQTQSLNLAVAFGIVLFERQRQLGAVA
jgi:tRNA G18 (ribose-2'-O)-methylase SpoU